MQMRWVRRGLGLGAVLTVAAVCQAGPAMALTTVFQSDLAGFNTAAGSPPIVINFDGLADNTNLAGQTVLGVTFSSPTGNSLPVVSSTQTVGAYSGIIDASTNKLFPTSGTKVLSPGGSDLVPGSALAEQDDLQLVLGTPQEAFGLDILFQSLDCCPFTSFQVFDGANQLLASGQVLSPNGSGGGVPGGSVFLGFVSDSANIAKIIISDSDGNNAFPDNNIGFDTVRFGGQTTRVPEPSTLLMAGLGFAALVVRSRVAAARRGRRHSPR